MAEITFAITRQADGWYLAAPQHARLGGATEALKYNALKGKVRECLHLALSDGFGKEIGLSENPDIRLRYEEPLFVHGGSEYVRIVGKTEREGYGVHMRKPFPLDIHRRTVEELREAVQREIARKGYQERTVVFTLEEVLGAERVGMGTPKRQSSERGRAMVSTPVPSGSR